MARAADAPADPPAARGLRSSCCRSNGRVAPRARPGRRRPPCPPCRRRRSSRRSQARARAVDLVFGLSMLVAVGGVAFAVGRATAPASTASTAARTGLGGFAGRTGQGTDRGPRGTPGRAPGKGPDGRRTGQRHQRPERRRDPQASGGPNAVVIPQAGERHRSTVRSAATGTRDWLVVPGAGAGAGSGEGPPGWLRCPTCRPDRHRIRRRRRHHQLHDHDRPDDPGRDDRHHHLPPADAATAADVVVGSSVRVTVEGGFGGGFGGGQPGHGRARGERGARRWALPRPRRSARTWRSCARERKGPAPRPPARVAGQGRGFGRGGLTGTVTAIGDGTISISTAGGQTIDVATTGTTTYHGEAAATADGCRRRLVHPHHGRRRLRRRLWWRPARVRREPARLRAPEPLPVRRCSITASDVEVLLPAGQ